MTAEAVTGAAMLILTALGYYTGAANYLCQKYIEIYIDELVKAEKECGKDGRDRVRRSVAYINMITYCDNPMVWKGARDFANSL